MAQLGTKQEVSGSREIVCYVKMDGTEELAGEAFKDKGEIEDALDERLRAEGLGLSGAGPGFGTRTWISR